MSPMDATIRAFKEMQEKKPLSIKRAADGRSVEMNAPVIEDGDLVDFSWPFIWWADPDLIFWNGGELIIILSTGPVCFRAYAYDPEFTRYRMWRAW